MPKKSSSKSSKHQRNLFTILLILVHSKPFKNPNLVHINKISKRFNSVYGFGDIKISYPDGESKDTLVGNRRIPWWGIRGHLDWVLRNTHGHPNKMSLFKLKQRPPTLNRIFIQQINTLNALGHRYTIHTFLYKIFHH